MQNPIQLYIQDHLQDAVLFKTNHLLKIAADDIHAENEAIGEIAQMISYIESSHVREGYISTIVKNHKKIKAVSLAKRVDSIIKEKESVNKEIEQNERALPSWINKEKFYTIGFDQKIDGINNTGFYFHVGEKGAKQMTNFVMTPKIHVYSKDDQENRRLTEVNNGISKTVLELPSKAFTSVDQFESILMNEGVFFLMDGFNKSHLNKIKASILREYPKCYELKTLGWQPEGFWAYSNRIYKDSLLSFNEYGYTDVEGVNYLSMSASSIQSEVRAEDDSYKNDRFLQWSSAPIDWNEWSKLMVDAYGEHAWLGTMYVFVTLFRDIVFALNSSCPHLYIYGAVQSGKSVFAESINNLFFKEMPFFNLNQGTDFAFFNRLERFRNCPAGFNEFDENAIKEEWFRAIKSGFDGEGRERGSMSKRNKTKTQEVLCTIILIGQYLSTKDDASVLSRCLPRQLSANNRTEKQVDSFRRLKAYEKGGLGGILVELLQHRKKVEETYADTYHKEFKKLSIAIEKEGYKVKTRIQNNFSTVLTMRKVMDQVLKFPFSYDEFFDMCKREIIKLSQMISESDSLASFWKTMEFMLDQDMISDGWDFKIEVKDSLPIMISRSEAGDGKNTKEIKFEEPKKLLFMRMTTIHPMYMQAIRQQTGKTGLNQETIVTYMKDLDAFVGVIKSTSFKKKGKSTVSNAYVFDYDLMNINIERFVDANGVESTIEGEVRYSNAEIVDVLGNTKLKWTMKIDRSYEKDGLSVKNIIPVTCYSNQMMDESRLTVGTRIKATGMLSERVFGDAVKADMQVSSIDYVLDMPEPVENVEPLPF